MNFRIARFRLVGFALAALGLSCEPIQATNYWKNSVVTGTWSNGNNWSATSALGADNAGVPTLGEAANIVFTDGASRTITYDVAAPSLGLLSIDLTGPGATTATLSMPSTNDLTTNGISVGGYTGGAATNGRGTISQSAGTVTTNPIVGDLVLGFGAGSTGVYTLSGGAFVNNLNEYVGFSGTGTFNHSAGSNTINASASGFFSVGHNSNSTGAYNLGGAGALVVNTSEYVGYSGIGAFNQTGGTNTISGTGHNLYLGFNTGSGTYTLSGGALSVSGNEQIGSGRAGTFNQSGGTNSTSSKLLVKGGSSYTLTGGSLSATLGADIAATGVEDSAAILIVDGVGSSFTTGGASTSSWGNGLNVSAVVTIRNGATANLGNLTLGGSGTGTLNVQASAAGTTTVTTGDIVSNFTVGNITVGNGTGLATLTQTGASVLSFLGGLTVNSGGIFNAGTGTMAIYDRSSLNINGGTFATGGNVMLNTITAPDANFNTVINLTGAGSHFTQTGATSVTVGNAGGDSSTVVNIGAGGTFTTGSGGMAIDNFGTVNILGGSLVSNGSLSSTGVFNFQSGSLSYIGNLTVGGGGMLGASVTLNADRNLSLSGTTTIDLSRSLVLNGGTLNTGALANNGTFTFTSGTLGITGTGGLTVGSGGSLGTNFTLGAGRTLNVTQTTTTDPNSRLQIDSGGVFSSGIVTNQGEFALNGTTASAFVTSFANYGVLRGTGHITAAVTNTTSGDIRAAAGERLQFDGALLLNDGVVEAIGNATSVAEIEFASPVTNAASTGLITGRNNVLRFYGGLTNQGSIAVSTGTSDVFGDITNAPAGTIVVSGGAAATFYDDMVQNGTFRVSKVGSTTSVAVVFGAFSGAGGSTGGGDIFFEGDLRPGNSPASVTFDNNVGFGAGNTLKVELGGTTAGSQYDQVHVTGQLALDGALEVSLVNFNPLSGQSFDILDWGSLSGMFATINLPMLVGLTWNTSQLYTTGTISVGLVGDYDNNGSVDAADYVVWRKTGGTQAAYNTWRSNFGQPPGSSASFITYVAVPEPATLVLLMFAAADWCLRRRSGRQGLLPSKAPHRPGNSRGARLARS